MIPIHKDVLNHLQQITMLFWRAQIISGPKLFSNLRKGIIQLGLLNTRSKHYSITQQGYKLSGANKPDNRYNGNEDLH